MYVLRSKVKLTDASADTALIGVTGPNAETIARALGLPAASGDMRQCLADGMRGIRLNPTTHVLAVPADRAGAAFERALAAGGSRAGTDAWQLAMIRAGLPLITAATQEEFVAQMLNYELIGGVNFKKGCYPGQEIVARTQYLGKLKKRMYRVRIDAEQAPAAGTDLYTPAFGEQSAGKLVNVAASPDGGYEALAVMQISCADTGEIHLGSPEGAPLVVLGLPYAVE
jgi:folate-binding protein YgfZ